MNFFQKIILIITLPLVILFLIIQINAFDYNWYEKEFVKLNTIEHFSQERINSQVQNLFLYLQNKEELKNNYYTEREILHLIDIKNILKNLKILGIILILIFALNLLWLHLKFGNKKLTKTIFQGAGITAFLFSCFFVFLFFNFEAIFISFHKIAFFNDFWQLNPDVESLIVIFPPQLFSDLIFKIIAISFGINIAILLVSRFISSKK